MRGTRGTVRFMMSATLALGVVAGPGCQSISGRKVASTEPGLSPAAEAGTTVVQAPVAPGPKLTVVDRHPLFSKPRDYYESSGNNKVVKTAAAAIIGVPVGLFGEIKQIVVGTPAEPRF